MIHEDERKAEKEIYHDISLLGLKYFVRSK